MAYQYFTYKLNNVTNIGGIVPPQPDNGDLGIYTYGDWYVGRVDTTNLDYFQKAKEFNLNPCTESEALGFQYLAVTQVTDSSTGELRDLNSDELTLKAAAAGFLAKLALRPRVAAFVGDQDDQLSDMAKRIALLERCFIMLAHAQMTEADAPTIAEPWKTIMETFYTDYTAGNLKDPIDIRSDGPLAIYTTLRDRSNALTEQLRQYYISVGLVSSSS